jgi:predicted DNA-binding protein (MmcQ/YjbR family)
MIRAMTESRRCSDAPTDVGSRLTPAELRNHLLSFAGAAETFPFGPETSVFKVAGKVFALSHLGAEPLRVSLKCEPRLVEALRAAHPEVIPGYHLNKRHWNTVSLEGSLPAQMIKNMIEDSYDLVVSGLPASRRRALGWQGG